jgi:hypothetical protein
MHYDKNSKIIFPSYQGPSGQTEEDKEGKAVTFKSVKPKGDMGAGVSQVTNDEIVHFFPSGVYRESFKDHHATWQPNGKPPVRVK